MNQIFCEDCMTGLDRIEDGSVDLVIMDPPYELETTGGGSFGNANRTYHEELTSISKGISTEVLDKIISKMKKVNLYVWCNKAQLRQYIDYFDDLGCNMDLLTWHKTNPTPTCNNKYLSDTEYLLFFREKGVKVYGSYDTKHKFWVTPLNTEDKKKWGHPTVKPLDITKMLVINSTLGGGETVLDPFLGPAPPATACLQTGPNFIGFGISEKFYTTATRRIALEKSQTHLDG